MRKIWKVFAIGSLVLFGASACADLEVQNLNDPDAERSLASAGDVSSLITGSYNAFFVGFNSYSGPGMFMSNAAFTHNAPWANSGMEHYGRLPRVAIVNDVADPEYGNVTRVWYRSYRAIAAASDGLRSLEDPDIADELGAAEVTRLKAFAKFTLGMAHAGLAMLYDRGFIVDETTDLTQAQEPSDYMAMMDAAMGYLDEAIAMANSNSFTIDATWMANEFSSSEWAKILHSYKARFMSQVARTPSERAALNWSAIKAEVDAGITDTYIMTYDWDLGWEAVVMGYQAWYSWSQMAYYMYGMADQSGNYQEWLSLPLVEKSYQFADGRDVLIVTPDDRFPQGSTVAEQMPAGGTTSEILETARHDGHYLMMTPPDWQGNTWKRPDRGTWRWSWYKNSPGHRFGYWWDDAFDQPEIPMAEMNLLEAEALYRAGDMAGAAALVNISRTAHGLNATDASGTNTSCVPKLPNGQCGDLWEMLKWEKRMETMMTGYIHNSWWFDGRGWGDLYKDTPLQFPIPCQELQVLQMLPCNTYGGPGGEMGAATSTYNFPFEG
jgi:hypothetical protein